MPAQLALSIGPEIEGVAAAYNKLLRLPYGSPERRAAAASVQATCSGYCVDPLAGANAWHKTGTASTAGRVWARAIIAAAEEI